MTSVIDSARDITVRGIARRLVVRGTLELTAPAHFGGGVESDLADMALLRDVASGGLLLPGTSIAGALRSFLRAYEQGHREEERPSDGLAELPLGGQKGDTYDNIQSNRHKQLAELLLGGQKGDPDGEQSPLLIADSLAKPTAIEVRDGVAIDPRTRTAREQKKYNLELVPVGTRFPLEVELLLPDDEDKVVRLRAALALALGALQRGEITVGARGSRGYGACRAHSWSLTTYDLANADHLLAYLVADRSTESDDPNQAGWQRYAVVSPVPHHDDDIVALLGAPVPTADTRKTVTLTAHFALASPLLIRSDLPEYPGEAPDATHLRRPKSTEREPVLPGTSVAGALRARAIRIANTLGAPNLNAIESLFGPEQGREVGKRTLKASRLRVSEQAIANSTSLVQSRVSIDRFTGGALDTALFSEAPLTRGDVKLTITIHDPEDAELGLLMLLLKDLWTGDLPLGGTSSVGRGRLRGIGAGLSFSPEALPAALKPTGDGTPQLAWPIGAEERLTIAPALATYLETCVQAIPGWLRQEKKDA